ncbi:MAG: chemotaxis protein CheW [Polyangiaceae bacterium]
MSRNGSASTSELAERLRVEFDAAFAREVELERPAHEDLLTFQVAATRYAVKSRDVRALLPTPKLARVPSDQAQLLGVGGVRGELIPVFDLGLLLGHPAASELGRWSLLVGAQHPLGLTFQVFERHERVALTAISSASDGGALGNFTEHVVRIADSIVPIIAVAKLVQALEGQDGALRGRESS